MTCVNVGSVSTGTLRSEDLAGSFLWELQHNTGAKGRMLYRRLVRANRDILDEDGEIIPEDHYNEAAHEDGQTWDEALDGLVGELFEVLEECAPPFFYFGSLEGDGADFGFWLSHESLEEAVREGEVWRDDSTGPCPICGERVTLKGETADGRDIATCGDAFKRGRWQANVCPKTAGYRLVVSDHGNMSLYYRNGREVWSIV